MRHRLKRTGFYTVASALFMTVMLLGFTVFYHFTEDLSFFDAFYFTVITTRTIGFGDISPQTTIGRIGTIINALLPATIFFGVSLVLVESALVGLESWRHRWLMKQHRAHTVVIADLELMPAIVMEYTAGKVDFVMIHQRPYPRLPAWMTEHLTEEFYIEGDATKDEILRAAGVDRAERVLIATNDDSRNMFILVSARGLNPKLTTIVRVNEFANEAKFRAVGADHLLPMTSLLGRMLSEAAVAPIAHEFLVTLQTRDHDPFLQEFRPSRSQVGKPVREIWPETVAIWRDRKYLLDLDQVPLQDADVALVMTHLYHATATDTEHKPPRKSGWLWRLFGK